MGDLIAGLVVGWALISGWAITVTCECWTGGGVESVDIAAVGPEGLLDCYEHEVVSGVCVFFLDFCCSATAIEFSQNELDLLSVPHNVRHFVRVFFFFLLKDVFWRSLLCVFFASGVFRFSVGFLLECPCSGSCLGLKGVMRGISRWSI